MKQETSVSLVGKEVSSPDQRLPECSERDKGNVEDFLDPIGFVWTEESFEARQALKTYSEATHTAY